MQIIRESQLKYKEEPLHCATEPFTAITDYNALTISDMSGQIHIFVCEKSS